MKKSSTVMINPQTALYTSEQLYQIERQWFDAGHDSFGLMQQASWQMACWIEQTIVKNRDNNRSSRHTPSALVWVGSGNNGGDGWLVAHFLRQFGWIVSVMEVTQANTTDSKRAKKIAIDGGITVSQFQGNETTTEPVAGIITPNPTTIYIDALFGIGLDRPPTGIYAQAIQQFNHIITTSSTQAISVDIPSGLVASTGQVFDSMAIQADMTLCLIANKLGLFTKDGKEHAGQVVTLPLIPLLSESTTTPKPVATKLTRPLQLPKRQANTHKGTFGHLLIIGGNKTISSQGMGGATILATQGAFAVGVGKLSVACHSDFHVALLANMPNAMTVDLHKIASVRELIEQVDTIAIGMGLGRDEQAGILFANYLHYAIDCGKDIIIDADGLYHLANLTTMHPSDSAVERVEKIETKDEANNCENEQITQTSELLYKLNHHAQTHFIAYTPHSGEMARLLSMSNDEVENNRLAAITQARIIFGGNWLLKGAGSLIVETVNEFAESVFLCDAGNSGMATAGMGDVLSGMVGGLQAQNHQNSLTNAVMIHALAGDELAERVGRTGVNAQDMAWYIKQVCNGSVEA